MSAADGKTRSIKVTPRPDDRIQEMIADPAGYFGRAREHRIAEARAERVAKSPARAADDMTAHYRNEWRTARTQHRRARANYFWWLVVHAITAPANKVKG